MSLPTTPPPPPPQPPLEGSEAQGWGHWICCGGSVDNFGKKTRISNWSETPIELHLKCGEALVRTYPIPHSGRKKLRWERARQLCGGDDSNISVWVMGASCSDLSDLSTLIPEPITSQDLHGCTEIKIRRRVDNPELFFLLKVHRPDTLARRASGSSRGRRSHHSSSRFSYNNSNSGSSSRYIYRSPPPPSSMAARPSSSSSFSSSSQLGVPFHSIYSYDNTNSGRCHQQPPYNWLSASNSSLPAATIDGIEPEHSQHNGPPPPPPPSHAMDHIHPTSPPPPPMMMVMISLPDSLPDIAPSDFSVTTSRGVCIASQNVSPQVLHPDPRSSPPPISISTVRATEDIEESGSSSQPTVAVVAQPAT